MSYENSLCPSVSLCSLSPPPLLSLMHAIVFDSHLKTNKVFTSVWLLQAVTTGLIVLLSLP